MTSRLGCVDCPRCHAPSRVLESRSADAGAAIRRRRECSSCGDRFTTYERYDVMLFVRKRNGRRQPFDRGKLRGALAGAAHKRPVSEAEIDAIADSVQAALVEAGGELPSAAVGELCLTGLGAADRGAFLQFAGTLPPEDLSRLGVDPEFAGSLPAGSVRAEGNSPEFTPRTG
jgi:transcriptional repressor NrdR